MSVWMDDGTFFSRCGNDALVAEMGIRLLARRWMDPFMEVDLKIVIGVVAHLTAPSGSRCVLCQMFRSFTQMLQTRLLPDVARILLKAALDRSTDPRGSVRAEALETLGRVCDASWVHEAQLVQGFSEFAREDSDAFVRTAALNALLCIHDRLGIQLPPSLWSVAVASLDDGVAAVRGAALSLLRYLASLYGSEPAPGRPDRVVRDQVFVLLCNAASDPKLAVRCRATELLGTMDGVNRHILVQALFKKPLLEASILESSSRTDMPPPTSVLEAVDLEVTQWTVQAQEVPGAFVHALEEEFWEVRMAALSSICELSLRSSEFAKHALDYVVDMLHDENSDVRLNAIHSLRRMGASGDAAILKADHLSMLHFLLSEDSRRIRNAVQGLLRDVLHPDTTSFEDTVSTLFVNLARYPDDVEEVTAALAGLGKRHPEHCELLVERLFQIDRRFVLQERTVSDPVYLATLVLFYSSGRTSLLPAFALRHREYVTSRWPHLLQQHQEEAAAHAVTLERVHQEEQQTAFQHVDTVVSLARGGMIAGAESVLRSAQALVQGDRFSSGVLVALHSWLQLVRGSMDPGRGLQRLCETSLFLEKAFSGHSLALLESIRMMRAPRWDPSSFSHSFDPPRLINVSLRIVKSLKHSPQLLTSIALPIHVRGVLSNVTCTNKGDLALFSVFPDCSWSLTALEAHDFAPGNGAFDWEFTKQLLLRFAAKVLEPINVFIWLVRRVAESSPFVVGVFPQPKGAEALGALVALHEEPLLFTIGKEEVK